MAEPTNPTGPVEIDAEARARDLEQRAAATLDPCEREQLLYLAHFARSGRVRRVPPAGDERAEP